VTAPGYAGDYPVIAMARSATGVLEMRLHSDGGPFRFSSAARAQLIDAFGRVGADRANRVVILTGTGDVWCAEFDRSPAMSPDPDLTLAERWGVQFREGRRLLAALLDVDVPMIAAVNGPALIHSEYLLTCDIILAAEGAAFQDKPHLDNGVSPTDGVHVLWPDVLGSVRGRYFLLTQQRIGAAEALVLGVCNEVLASDALLPRAHAIAERLARQPDPTLRGARVGLTQRLKRLVTADLPIGLALESVSALAKA
jgi:enoyl-CoA hydratase/carnithine racemase